MRLFNSVRRVLMSARSSVRRVLMSARSSLSAAVANGQGPHLVGQQDVRSRMIRAKRVHDDPEVPHDLLERPPTTDPS